MEDRKVILTSRTLVLFFQFSKTTTIAYHSLQIIKISRSNVWYLKLKFITLYFLHDLYLA